MERSKVTYSNGHRRTPKSGYDSDALMLGLWNHLLQDFRSSHGDPLYCERPRQALRESVAAFRGYKFPDRFQAPINIFKSEYQLENLFKRYKFKRDVYTEQELEERTNYSFLTLQTELATQRVEPSYCFRVVQKARQIIREILGPYDVDEHMQFCRFGKRACKGTPARNAYLDSKLALLSGSREHIDWFEKTYLPTDSILLAAIKDGPHGPNYTVCDSLDMTNVPKSWKILRGICPNTSLGSFYTYGLGALFQDRLQEKARINIRTCQNRHKRLARKYSVTRECVTADLSNASNSFIFQLLCRLLPRDWLRAVKFGRLAYTKIGGSKSPQTILTSSYMMMGIGYTFTLQTLLFYSLIKAVQNLLGDERGVVSVYGDDLIYPRRIHEYVSRTLVGLGFQLNMEKTYVDSHFRESCGGDYYRGADVRPFQPEGQHQILRPKDYVLRVYQIINGLRERWEECEVQQTLLWLYSEILRVDHTIFQVPPHFPDYSGVRVDRFRSEFWLPWVKPIWSRKTFSHCFLCYAMKPYDRPVVSEYAYYWEAMRSGSTQEPESPYDLLEDKAKILRFTKASPQPRNYRSFVSRKRIKKLVANVARKGRQQVVRKCLSGFASFDDAAPADMLLISGYMRGFVEKRLWKKTKLVNRLCLFEPDVG